ncbi:hypothetical protein FHW88_004366 [Mucilaginibacter sp. SG538B]|nr:hypothetical protein [Mucilaginibacter sp. SG538B]
MASYQWSGGDCTHSVPSGSFGEDLMGHETFWYKGGILQILNHICRFVSINQEKDFEYE